MVILIKFFNILLISDDRFSFLIFELLLDFWENNGLSNIVIILLVVADIIVVMIIWFIFLSLVVELLLKFN